MAYVFENLNDLDTMSIDGLFETTQIEEEIILKRTQPMKRVAINSTRSHATGVTR